MSVESMAWALQVPDLTPSQKLVLIGIANHDGDGGAWPSVATLARYACVSERQVQRILGQLEQRELITRKIQQGGHLMRDDLRPNLYVLHRPRTVDNWSNGVTPMSPRSGERGDTHVTPPVTPMSPEPSSNRTYGTDSSSSSQGCAHRFRSAETGECASCGAGRLEAVG